MYVFFLNQVYIVSCAVLNFIAGCDHLTFLMLQYLFQPMFMFKQINYFVYYIANVFSNYTLELCNSAGCSKELNILFYHMHFQCIAIDYSFIQAALSNGSVTIFKTNNQSMYKVNLMSVLKI